MAIEINEVPLDKPFTPKTVMKSTIFCPRCDRPYKGAIGESYRKLLDRVIKHVAEQHPDHDPEWYDTFPDHVD